MITRLVIVTLLPPVLAQPRSGEQDKGGSRHRHPRGLMKMDARQRDARLLVLAPALLVIAALFAGTIAFGADAPVRLRYPVAVACGGDGRLIVADLHLPGLLRREPSGALEVIFQGSPQNRTPLHAPRALAIGGDDTLFVADSATCEVYRLSPGRPLTALSAGGFEIPTGLAVSPAGDLFVADLRLGTVSRLPNMGGVPTVLARVPSPRGLALEANGDLVVVSMGPDALLRVTSDGAVSPVVTGRPFRFPCAVLLDEPNAGYVVSDSDTATLWAVTAQGKVRPWVKGPPLIRPEGLARDRSGAVLVADPAARQVFRIRSPREIEPLIAAPE
jgi:DNA-binding beta-propeller fold protein YncE